MDKYQTVAFIKLCTRIAVAEDEMLRADTNLVQYPQACLYRLTDEFIRDFGCELSQLGILPSDIPKFARFIDDIACQGNTNG